MTTGLIPRPPARPQYHTKGLGMRLDADKFWWYSGTKTSYKCYLVHSKYKVQSAHHCWVGQCVYTSTHQGPTSFSSVNSWYSLRKWWWGYWLMNSLSCTFPPCRVPTIEHGLLLSVYTYKPPGNLWNCCTQPAYHLTVAVQRKLISYSGCAA